MRPLVIVPRSAEEKMMTTNRAGSSRGEFRRHSPPVSSRCAGYTPQCCMFSVVVRRRFHFLNVLHFCEQLTGRQKIIPVVHSDLRCSWGVRPELSGCIPFRFLRILQILMFRIFKLFLPLTIRQVLSALKLSPVQLYADV